MLPTIRVCREFLLSLLSLILLGVPAWADWPAISPQDMKMTDLPQQKGAPAVVLLREEFADDPKHYRSVYVRIKILTEAGRRYADVTIPYPRRSVTIGGVAGRTVHADGSIVPFAGQVFDKMVVREKIGRGQELRVHVKSFTLPDVQVGSILDYKFTMDYDDRLFYAPDWIIQNDLFQMHARFKFIPFSGQLLLAHKRIGNGVVWTSYLPPKGPQPEWHRMAVAVVQELESREAEQFIELKMNDIPALIDEPFMPPKDALRYRVEFFYQTNTTTSDGFWKEEGRFWSKDVEKFLDQKGGIEGAVANTVSPDDSPEQKVRKIYAFVTGLENQSYRPQRQDKEQKALGLKPNEGVEDVLRQSSGDHDDLNRLFVAMVRAARIPASMMWVASREESFFQPELLSTRQMDAEIAIVQLDGKDVFLDPGTKFCPYGLLDWRYSASKGLRQTEDGTAIVGSSLPNYNQAQIQRTAHLQLTDQGKVEGSLKVGFSGLEAMDRRQKANATDDAGRNKLLEDEVRGWLPADSEVILVGDPNWNDTEARLSAEFKFSSALAVGAGKRWFVPVHIFQVNTKPVFPASDRVNSIYLWYPTREADEVFITLPATLEVESLPPNDSAKLEYATYKTLQTQDSPNTIMARRELIMAGMAFPASSYKDLKDFYDKVKAGDDQQLIAKGAAHAETK